MIISKPLSRDLALCCGESTQPPHHILYNHFKALLPTICSSSSTLSSKMSLPASDSAPMEKLHQYICQQAFDSSQKPSLPAGFIGPIPPPPSLSFIGQRWLKEDTPDTPDEPTVRVMFRCQPTPTSASRHVLLHMKPSVREEALAKKLCEIFEIIQNGLVITKTMVEFLPDQCFLTEPNRGMAFFSRLIPLSSAH